MCTAAAARPCAVPVDECANIGQIPNWRSCGHHPKPGDLACLFAGQSQLKAIYKDNADTIMGNWTAPVPGRQGEIHPKGISELAGKGDHRHTTESEPGQSGFSLNYQKLGRELMTQRDRHDGRRQVYLAAARGAAVLSDKYDLTKHPNYKYPDADKKNA